MLFLQGFIFLVILGSCIHKKVPKPNDSKPLTNRVVSPASDLVADTNPEDDSSAKMAQDLSAAVNRYNASLHEGEGPKKSNSTIPMTKDLAKLTDDITQHGAEAAALGALALNSPEGKGLSKAEGPAGEGSTMTGGAMWFPLLAERESAALPAMMVAMGGVNLLAAVSLISIGTYNLVLVRRLVQADQKTSAEQKQIWMDAVSRVEAEEKAFIRQKEVEMAEEKARLEQIKVAAAPPAELAAAETALREAEAVYDRARADSAQRTEFSARLRATIEAMQVELTSLGTIRTQFTEKSLKLAQELIRLTAELADREVSVRELTAKHHVQKEVREKALAALQEATERSLAAFRNLEAPKEAKAATEAAERARALRGQIHGPMEREDAARKVVEGQKGWFSKPKSEDVQVLQREQGEYKRVSDAFTAAQTEETRLREAYEQAKKMAVSALEAAKEAHSIAGKMARFADEDLVRAVENLTGMQRLRMEAEGELNKIQGFVRTIQAQLEENAAAQAEFGARAAEQRAAYVKAEEDLARSKAGETSEGIRKQGLAVHQAALEVRKQDAEDAYKRALAPIEVAHAADKAAKHDQLQQRIASVQGDKKESEDLARQWADQKGTSLKQGIVGGVLGAVGVAVMSAGISTLAQRGYLLSETSDATTRFRTELRSLERRWFARHGYELVHK